VADDDLGVIAAYRLVLEESVHGRAGDQEIGIEGLEEELFGACANEAAAPWIVDFVDQGADAVAAVERAILAGNPYSAAFLDVRMPPGLDGYETAELIRKLDPDLHIVFVSGYCDYHPIDLVDVGGGPANTTIMPKPVWPDELRAIATTMARARRAA
jgi:CheY-like chemotaxis protein